MNRLLISTMIAAAAFSANAFAHGDRDDDHWEHHRHHREERVVVQNVYAEPEVIYYQAPPVIYRERIVYRDRPVYYEAAPRYYEQPATYPGNGSNRLIGQAIGAIAGGALGNQVGRGNGRIAATAIGAVVGSAIGGNVAYPGY
ncbi:hypothetical protein SKTS_34800 [Sulfurimicrobium lacus]|uniref:Glycine zipper 2TM domain-containing protein n=1 Tax=Sulfurimicrobium lacus TaxID=2715678 RepID=A0A6F8VFZ2_9PROT|nr:glycine zipper 2TM domain-containing protein [Sulfurimicrobium lacus]BCB28594.1 hypothetical protein SKTS_34800 [Sulfurimicrobium lacus]